MSWYLWMILGYLLILAGFNFWRAKQVTSQDDFMVAGRSLSLTKMVFTLVCTWIGSGTFIAGAEYAYRAGLSSLWMPAGAWAGICVIYFLAGKIRTFGQYTIGDILEVKANCDSFEDDVRRWCERLGKTLQQAVLALAARVPGCSDLRIFAVSVNVQRETGGNLAEILDKIAATIRERFRFHGKLRALTAEGRASAWVLGVLPFLVTLVLAVINPRYIGVLFRDPLKPTVPADA